MFEAAELGRKIRKKEYKTLAPRLRAELLDVQVRLREAPFSVIAVFAGVDGAGKGETVNLLTTWMDPRWISTRSFGEPSDEERERPEFWRYWRALPPRGRIGLFLRSWYSQPLLHHVQGMCDAATFDARLARIADFEKTLATDGALLIKFWMHLDKDGQRERLRRLERDPLTRWRVTKREWKHWKMYDDFVAAAERLIRRTDRPESRWILVEGADEEYRSLAVGSALKDAVETRLDKERAGKRPVAVARAKPATGPARGARERRLLASASILSSLDMHTRLRGKKAAVEIERWQGRLNLLQRKAAASGVSTVVVFEGWDAAGKGGAIRRVTTALDASNYQVIPIAAPTDEERAHHYLWRFWRHLARAGRVTIFDRSWYGRVLVERVEGFASEAEWARAFGEINQFEDQLVEHGTVLVKFWIHVTREEQLRRFRERQSHSWTRWKITDEDWRNRKRWPLYEAAVNDMVEKTSTRLAPWTLVEGNDKPFARVKVLRTVHDSLERGLSGR